MKNLIFSTSVFIIVTQTYSVNAATITFGSFSYSAPQTDLGSTYENSSPNILRARSLSLEPGSRVGRVQSSTTQIRQHSNFTVNPTGNERNGQTIGAVLKGNLLGELSQNVINIIGSCCFASVAAKVDAGPISWSSPSHILSNSSIGSVLVRDEVFGSGDLTIGETYNFDMVLFVNSRVSQGAGDFTIEADSDFYTSNGNNNRRFYATVEAVPEPLTILASGIALGFGGLFKKQYSRKQNKTKSLEKRKV